MFNNLMFTSRFIKGYSKSFNLILQYNLEAQQLIKRERALAGHYTIILIWVLKEIVLFSL